MQDNASVDVLDTLTRYAPTSASVSAEWGAVRRADTLAGIIGSTALADGAGPRPDVHHIPLRFVPAAPSSRRQRWAHRLPVLASVAMLAAAAAVLAAVLPTGGSGSRDEAGGSGPAFVPPAGLSHAGLGSGQYSYRVVQQIDLGADGKPKPNGPDAMIARNWVAPNGDIVSIRTGSQHGCMSFPHGGNPNFGEPTEAFFDSLPTGVGALTGYLREHVSGSSSRDEAVFVAVGDALRTADGLASPRLRGALVGVLSRTPGVVVHQYVRDYLGRPALRADFVDQKIRPGEVQSLYFDPTTFRLLEEREGANGQPTTYNGPSPAYGATPGPADDPAALTGTAFVAVMTSERVVDRLPQRARHCSGG